MGWIGVAGPLGCCQRARCLWLLVRLPLRPSPPSPPSPHPPPAPSHASNRFGKQYDKNGDYIRHFLPVLKVGAEAAHMQARGRLQCTWMRRRGGRRAPPRLPSRECRHDTQPMSAVHASPTLQPCPPAPPFPPNQDMPAKYIYEPWTAPPAVQQAAGCIIGKDYPRCVWVARFGGLWVRFRAVMRL